MSVALLSWAARTLSSFSGCDDREGGQSRRVLGDEEVLLCGGTWVLPKSELVSRVTEGAMPADRLLQMHSVGDNLGTLENSHSCVHFGLCK